MMCDFLSIAQNIVSGGTIPRNENSFFHPTSFIYKTTNEDMHEYQKFLEKRKKVLTVVSSSEQIFNQVVEGTRNIDIFDISIFPYFFFELKRSGILTFSEVSEYCNFFYGDITSDFDSLYDDLYDSMRKYLESDIKEFWDGLFQFFDWSDTYNFMLFSSESWCLSQVLLRNKHLDSLEYQNLRNDISDVTITPYIGDINKLASDFTSTYDFINLSNICSYQDVSSYVQLLRSLPLMENGDILSYFYSPTPSVQSKFKGLESNFFVFPNNESGVMIYTKKYK